MSLDPQQLLSLPFCWYCLFRASVFACCTFDIGDDLIDLLSDVRAARDSCLINQWAPIGNDFDVRRPVVVV